MANEPVILDDRARFLAGRGHNFTSQFGEDGLIKTLFEKTGITNRWTFEVGAADGLFYSNTKQWRDADWNAVLIEGIAENFVKLQVFASDRVRCVPKMIGPHDLDRILAECGAPADLDFGVIDIDGADYYVWRGMEKFQPRAMLVEFSPYQSPHYLPDFGGPGQAGLNPLIALGEAKGYTALCHTYCNVLFLRTELALTLEANVET
jgi:hypothetical protein